MPHRYNDANRKSPLRSPVKMRSLRFPIGRRDELVLFRMAERPVHKVFGLYRGEAAQSDGQVCCGNSMSARTP